MLDIFRVLFTFMTAISLFVTGFVSPAKPGTNSEDLYFEYLQYPEQIVSFEEAGISNHWIAKIHLLLLRCIYIIHLKYIY